MALKTFLNYIFPVALLSFPMWASADKGKFKIPDNFNTPKTVVLALSSYPMGNFAENIYKVIHAINKSERLTGTTGPKQAIHLLIIAGQEWLGTGTPDETLKELADNLSRDLKLDRNKIPYLQIARIPSSSQLPWMQDIAKPALLSINGLKPVQSLLDLNYKEDGTRLEHVKAIAETLNLKIDDIMENTIPGEGDQGGNIAVTPDGRLYVGDTLSPFLTSKLESLTGQRPIVIPTDWLMVGHVDEIISFIPSPRGPVLVYADPLAALNKMRTTGQSEIGDDESIKKTIESMEYFLKSGRKSKTYLEADDFDLSRPMRTGRDGNGVLKYEDYDVKANIFAAIQISQAVGILQGNSAKKSLPVGVPVLYRHADFTGVDDPKESEIYLNLQAFNPMPNLVVLRDHIIVSDSFYTKDFADRVGPIIGRNKIHFVGASGLEVEKGSIHCATMVIRDL